MSLKICENKEVLEAEEIQFWISFSNSLNFWMLIWLELLNILKSSHPCDHEVLSST